MRIQCADSMKSTLYVKISPDTFWRKVRRAGPEDCWPWTGKPDEDGYGRVSMIVGDRRRNLRAHRVVAALHLEDYSDALVVRHSCDNPACCNPAHLLMGTQAENIADRDARKRRKPPSGGANGRAKLTEQDVRDIRASNLTQMALAARYGVEHSLIGRIQRRERWAHVE